MLGIAAAYVYAADDRARYADFFERGRLARRARLQRGRGGRAAGAVPRAGRRDQAGSERRLTPARLVR